MVILSNVMLPSWAGGAGCGMTGDEASVPGEGYAGYWTSTLGLIRLVGLQGNILEGAATGSEYIKGVESGVTFNGRFAEDTGRVHTGTVSFTLYNGGRCLKGVQTYNDGGQDEVLGFRVKPSHTSYGDIYVLDQHTERLKQTVGGQLTFKQLDGPNRLAIQGTPPAVDSVEDEPALDTSDSQDTGTEEQESE